LLAGLWITLITLTLLTAEEQRERVARDEWFGSQSWAVELVDAGARFASALGLTELYAASQAAAAALIPDPPRSGGARLALLRERREQSDERASEGEYAADQPTHPAGAQTVGPGTTKAPRPLDLGHIQVRRVLLVGASSFQFYLGAELEELLTKTYDGVQVLRRAKVSTGLARPDRMDWPRELALLVKEFSPDLVISDFGGNDAQNMLLPSGERLKFGTPEWDAEYRARVGRIIQISQRAGSRVALLGMPSARSPSFSRRMQQLNVLIEQEALQRGAVFVPTWDFATDSNGRYREAVTVDGVRGLMRLADGKHYSRLGAISVARKLVQRVEQSFPLVPGDRNLAISLRQDISSAALGRDVPCIAYVPQAVARRTQRAPVLYLLHGADATYADWPDRAHRTLQRLASEHGLIIVIPDGARDGWYVDSPSLPKHRYATWFVNELLPYIDAWLPTDLRRGLAGQSAGGHGAFTLALTHPGRFRSASSMSGVLDLTQARTRPALIRALGPYTTNLAAWHARSAMHLVAQKPKVARRVALLMTVGSSDRWAPVNRAFSQQLAKLHVPHEFYEADGGHDWQYWVSELPRHVAWHAAKLSARAP
jgi:enterochelin esterase-like enzyme